MYDEAIAIAHDKAHGLDELHERLTELRGTWRDHIRPTWTEMVARRVAEFEICAREFAKLNGWTYREWFGGTSEEAEAWCRNTALRTYDHATPAHDKGPPARRAPHPNVVSHAKELTRDRLPAPTDNTSRPARDRA